MRRLIVTGFIAASAVLAGCSSPDVMYYTLSPATTAVAQPNQQAWTHPYRIGLIKVPAQVDDTALVVRQSADQMMVLSYDRWSATLSEQFRDALSQAMTQQLGMPPMQNLASASALRDTTQITVDVQRFELLPGKEALMAVVWRISPMPATAGRKKPMTAITCYSVLRAPSAVGVAALVTAQQHNLVALSAQIAQVLKTGQATAIDAVPAPTCY